jgi:hypothetical protein
MERPVIECESVKVRKGENPVWRFWCEHCKTYHHHGAMPGHRIAHCHVKTSPYLDGGYILVAPKLASGSV